MLIGLFDVSGHSYAVHSGSHLAQAKGLFFRSSLELGTACRMLAQTAMTCGVILARLLKEPNVTKPLALAGSWETAGASTMNNSVSSGHLGQAENNGMHAGKACSHKCTTGLHNQALRKSPFGRHVASEMAYTSHMRGPMTSWVMMSTLSRRVAQEAAWQAEQLLGEGLLRVDGVGHRVCDAEVHGAQPGRVGVPDPGRLQGNSSRHRQSMKLKKPPALLPGHSSVGRHAFWVAAQARAGLCM